MQRLLIVSLLIFPKIIMGTNVSRALDYVEKEIEHVSLCGDDLQHTIEFIEFYSSWYAPVTPAPYSLKDSLSYEACQFIEKIKALAKQFEKKPDPRIMGASRLTSNGRLFFEKVIEKMKDYATRERLLCEKRHLEALPKRANED